MKNLHLALAALLLLLASSCGGGSSNQIDSEGKKIAALICKAKGADEATASALQKEIKTTVNDLRSKIAEEAKTQKGKTPEEFLKESGQKLEDLVNAEAAKSCGITKEEIENFMRHGKLEKPNYGPHVDEVKGLTPEVFTYTSSGKVEIYTKVSPTNITVWTIDYNKKGTVEISRKEIIELAKVDASNTADNLVPKAVPAKFYTEGTFELTVKAKTDSPNGELFLLENFVTNNEVKKMDFGTVTLSFKTMAAAQAIADQIKAAATTN